LYQLDIDPMTLRQDLDLDILKMYLLTKTEVFRSVLSNITAQTEQTDKQTAHTRRRIRGR